jgi:DNA-binding NtrC family response regulator
LRERREDIPLLVDYFLKKFAATQKRASKSISAAAIQRLDQYHWPGNVRELENVIQSAMIMNDSDAIEAADLPAMMKANLPRADNLSRSLASVEVEHIRNVLAHVGGNKSRAAQILGIDRKTLRQKLQSSKEFEH